MPNVVHSLKGLKRVHTPAGPRWYDMRKGMYAKYVPPCQIRAAKPEGLKSYYKKNNYFKIEIKEEKAVIIQEGGPDREATKLVKDFLTAEEALDYYKCEILKKIKEGYRNWEPQNSQKPKKIGKWGKVVSQHMASFWAKRHKKNNDDEDEEVDRPAPKFRLPFGYVEITKTMANKIEKVLGHLAEFIKQGKRTKAIKDIRDLVKSKKIYSSIQYKVNFALDQYEEKGILYARTALKKGNKLTAHIKPGSSDEKVIVKASNLKRILSFAVVMLRVLKGLLVYHDARDPWMVKMMGRKGRTGPILLRPKRVHTLRFFNEGREVYLNSISVLNEFRTTYPRVARRIGQ